MGGGKDEEVFQAEEAAVRKLGGKRVQANFENKYNSVWQEQSDCWYEKRDKLELHRGFRLYFKNNGE